MNNNRRSTLADRIHPLYGTAGLGPTLIDATTRLPVAVGDTVRSFRGETATIDYFAVPHKPSSNGKVTVRFIDEATCQPDGPTGEYYVGVFGLEWINRTDAE